VYQDYDKFYITLFSSGVIIIARETPEIFADRVILASHNTSVAKLNNNVLKTINDDAQTFTSVNSAEQRSKDKTFYINNKYFHILKASGIFLARLMLKINASVILMRNMNPAKEFYNGIRYIVKRIYSRVIKVEISSGEFKDKYITLSRILCNFKKSDFEFIFTRR
jgi:hypothetical protein